MTTTTRLKDRPQPEGLSTEVAGTIILSANLIVWLAIIPAAIAGAL